MTTQFVSPEDFSTQEHPVESLDEPSSIDPSSEVTLPLLSITDAQQEIAQRSERMQDHIAELEFRATLAGIRRASMRFHGVTPTNRRNR